MQISIFLLLVFINSIARCFIFSKRDIKWWKSFIPIYNKYILGKLSNCKKLGILNCISQLLLFICFVFCFQYELWIIENYSTQATIPSNTDLLGKINVEVPKNIADIAIYSKYVLVAIAIVCLILWSMMMWNFIKLHKRNPWWIIVWTIMPTISYCYFAISNDVVIDGKMYTMKRVEKYE